MPFGMQIRAAAAVWWKTNEKSMKKKKRRGIRNACECGEWTK